MCDFIIDVLIDHSLDDARRLFQPDGRVAAKTAVTGGRLQQQHWSLSRRRCRRLFLLVFGVSVVNDPRIGRRSERNARGSFRLNGAHLRIETGTINRIFDHSRAEFYIQCYYLSGSIGRTCLIQYFIMVDNQS